LGTTGIGRHIHLSFESKSKVRAEMTVGSEQTKAPKERAFSSHKKRKEHFSFRLLSVTT
jgi:hypothetical protein